MRKLSSEREQELMVRVAVVALLAGLAGCGSATLEGALREERAPFETITITHPGEAVDVPEREFREVMGRLAADVAVTHLTLAPEARSTRLVLASWEPPKDTAGTRIAREYSAWCQSARHGPADCLSFGLDSFGFESKRRLALSIAIGSVIGGVADAVGEFVNPLKLEAMVVASIATYLGGYVALLIVPEPITKGLAAIMSLTLYAYLGHEFWDIVQGYRQMRDEADTATTFAGVHAAGDRFGHCLGDKGTRILIMVATACLGSGTDVAGKMRSLPRFTEASQAVALETSARVGATTRGGALTLGGVIGWTSEVVLGERRFGALVPAGALAMAASPNRAPGGQPVPGGSGGFKAYSSFKAFKRAMGSAGPGQEWHHIVEQTPSNVERFGAYALHNEKNVIPLDEKLHDRLSRLYSSINRNITGSDTLTIRAWLKNQSFEEQRRFGLKAIENVGKGIW